MKRYRAPQSESDPDLMAWLVASPTDLAVTALLALLMLFFMWQLARAIRRSPREVRRPSSTGPRVPQADTREKKTPEWASELNQKPPSRCRWKKDRWRSPRSSLTHWVCSECGAEGYSADETPPKECKRHLRSHQL